MKYFAALFFVIAAPAMAESSPDLWPWSSQNSPEPPPAMAYSLPTFEPENVGHKLPIPALVKAPQVPAESVFYRVLDCYPGVSKWKIDVDLEARIRSTDTQSVDAQDGTILGSSYIGLVASMPLYSATEMARERDRESKRRQDTAQTVALFVKSIADRNQSLRMLGLYSSLEARSRLRVLQGIAETTEQIQSLDKVAMAQKELIKAEVSILESRLKLMGYCRNEEADKINRYLARLAQVPTADAYEPIAEIKSR